MWINFSDLKTPVTFCEFEPNDGPMPGEEEKKTLYKTWAKVDDIWLKDMELAKSTGTINDLIITIRDPMYDYVPTNEHYVSIDDPHYRDKQYRIKHVQPDVQDRNYINIVAELHE